MNSTVTPEQALADLAANTRKVRSIPTKDQQKAWFEQYVVRNVRGQVVYSVKTWNVDALELAMERAAKVNGTVELVAEGRVAA